MKFKFLNNNLVITFNESVFLPPPFSSALSHGFIQKALNYNPLQQATSWVVPLYLDYFAFL